MSKKKYLIRINVLDGAIWSCDECMFDTESDYIRNGIYHVVVTANNPKDAQRLGAGNFSVAKAD